MIQLDLTTEEKEILKETLESAISDLGFEIADTEKMEWREKLKVKKAVLKKVLEAL